jgi:hypothetical protein
MYLCPAARRSRQPAKGDGSGGPAPGGTTRTTGEIAMWKLFTNSERAGRRSWLKIAVVSGLLSSIVSTPAHAGWGTLLYANDYVVADVSYYNNWVSVKGSSWVVPTTNYLTVQWSAWKGGPYNCATRVVIYNSSGYYINYAEHDGTPHPETAYYTDFYVQPGQQYFVYLYIRDPQTSSGWIYYNRIFQLVDGIAPYGNYVRSVY